MVDEGRLGSTQSLHHLLEPLAHLSPPGLHMLFLPLHPWVSDSTRNGEVFVTCRVCDCLCGLVRKRFVSQYSQPPTSSSFAYDRTAAEQPCGRRCSARRGQPQSTERPFTWWPASWLPHPRRGPNPTPFFFQLGR